MSIGTKNELGTHSEFETLGVGAQTVVSELSSRMDARRKLEKSFRNLTAALLEGNRTLERVSAALGVDVVVSGPERGRPIAGPNKNDEDGKQGESEQSGNHAVPPLL
ncbi:MAG: hypothetical protein WDN46_10195 [Methylocella sp.]